MEELRKVRTTMEPDREIEVTEQEYTDLSRQGLLHEKSKPGLDKAKGEQTR